MILDDVKRLVKTRGITRLCHFAPSRKLAQILMDERGILATQHLKDDERAVFDPTDLQRLDGHPEHVCCSIEYPNAWYFRKARNAERAFLDWVVLLVKPDHLYRPGVKFCPRNAAAGYGRYLSEGAEGLEGMFAADVEGAYGHVYSRKGKRPSVPTDDQAEVLVPDNIGVGDILAVAVATEGQAQEELLRLRTLVGHELLARAIPRLLVAPDFFKPNDLSRILQTGGGPTETEVWAGGDDAQ